MIPKKESVLRKKVKDFAAWNISQGRPVHLTWVESHQTALGAPDVQYCCYEVEGWLELKAFPDPEVRASQVMWMEEHIKAGGFPLFMFQNAGVFIIVAGSRAADLRHNGSLENIMRLAYFIGGQDAMRREFLSILRNPRRVYEHTERNTD